MQRTVDVISSWTASAARLGIGMNVGTLGPRPEKPLELYEFEACPYCRRVREALSVLDLDALVYPCPKGGTRYRKEVESMGGKLLFPFLIDPNTGVSMFESMDIVRYLFATYGEGTVPLTLRRPAQAAAFSSLASLVRLSKGVSVKAADAPEKPLELYSFEASPYCRIVREALCSYEIPYLLHNVGKGSPKRPEFKARAGKIMVPYLVDPNTGVEMFESAEIVDYLAQTYAH